MRKSMTFSKTAQPKKDANDSNLCVCIIYVMPM